MSTVKGKLPVPKTIEGVRDALFDEINLLRAGKSNLQQARAVAQLASQVIDSIRVGIQYGRLLQKAKGEPEIPLGSAQKRISG